MSREILFRGKVKLPSNWRGHQTSSRNGDWVYGLMESIESIRRIPVDTNTIGQYTGLTDKNGTKIFEGDILRNDYDNFTAIISCLNSTNEMVAEVINGGIMDLSSLQSHRIEIIGNIYDDPEFIEG